jgi:hypothetical protein
VATDHAADEEIQQKSFFGIGVPEEQGQFIASTMGNLLLRFSVDVL